MRGRKSRQTACERSPKNDRVLFRLEWRMCNLRELRMQIPLRHSKRNTPVQFSGKFSTLGYAIAHRHRLFRRRRRNARSQGSPENAIRCRSKTADFSQLQGKKQGRILFLTRVVAPRPACAKPLFRSGGGSSWSEAISGNYRRGFRRPATLPQIEAGGCVRDLREIFGKLRAGPSVMEGPVQFSGNFFGV
jgi:hypothetical protein